MKATFASLLALMAVFQTVSALPSADTAAHLAPLPTGSQDGFYAGSLNEDGTTTWRYLGATADEALASNFTALATSTTDSPALEKRGDSGVHCDSSRLINSNDRANAAAAFGNLCGTGLFFGSRSITYQSGSVIAYGCNYGNGQTCYANDVNGFLDSVSRSCGGNKAGWYLKESWKASYGSTAAGVGFC